VNVGVTLPTTDTVATAELRQLPDTPVTVTVYEFPATTLELADEKLTLLPVPERYVVGLQEYVAAPLACNVTEEPLQTCGLLTATISLSATFIVPSNVAGGQEPAGTVTV
jgi:hypothetical protein